MLWLVIFNTWLYTLSKIYHPRLGVISWLVKMFNDDKLRHYRRWRMMNKHTNRSSFSRELYSVNKYKNLENFRPNQAGLVKISRQGGLEKIHFQQLAPLILYIYGDITPSTLRKKYRLNFPTTPNSRTILRQWNYVLEKYVNTDSYRICWRKFIFYQITASLKGWFSRCITYGNHM